jgi:hypothetical protein
MWLFRDVPDLALLDGGAKRGLRIARATAKADEPLADGPTGSLSLYVAPAAAGSAAHPDAQEVARVPRLRFGVPGAVGEATLTAKADTALRRFATNPTEPLALVAVARIPIGALARVPRGAFAVTMDIELVSAPGF